MFDTIVLSDPVLNDHIHYHVDDPPSNVTPEEETPVLFRYEVECYRFVQPIFRKIGEHSRIH